MKVELEYGDHTIDADLPEQTDIFIAGETVADPPYLTDPVGATRQALENPIGMPPISELVGPGSKVTIVFPDRVKGGETPTSHRQVAIPLVLDQLAQAGVRDADILLICSNGLHAKNTPEQIRSILGDEVYRRFAERGQITNHDSEDYDNLVDLGTTQQGDPVLMNKDVHDSDLAIMIGHTMGNPYGGYSGGYKHSATGISHWRSIASHHVPKVMHRPDFVPVSTHSLMRHKFDEIGKRMEEAMRHPFFCVDAVLDSRARQMAVFAGRAEDIEPPSWAVAEPRTYVKWAEAPYDIVVFGLPKSFQYGPGMGTNPIMVLQAISAQIVRHKRVLSDNCVVVAAAELGWFHEELFTAQRDLYDEYAARGHKLTDLTDLGIAYAENPEYIRNYRDNYGFHPFHAFSMISSAEIAHKHTAAIFVAGAKVPGLARGMGMRSRSTVEECVAEALRLKGPDARILALPRAFKRAAVHLCLQSDDHVGLH